MALDVLLAVLVAALLHAGWNAVLKVSADRLVMLAVAKTATTVIALAAITVVPAPPPAAWPFIAASVAIHTVYFLTLTVAYRFGDLAQVYPLSRGASPLIVAGLAFVLLGETLERQALLALGLIALGVVSLMLGAGGRPFGQPKAVIAALATACCIAGYTVADGSGARLSDSALSYILWLNVFNGLPIILIAVALRRRTMAAQVRRVWMAGALSAAVSLAAYWIVLWAGTQAPLALVAAVREASMVFALLFGAVVLKERVKLRAVLSVFVTLAGTMLLRTSR